jgi:L-lactate dehydrogenase complex protein LldG
MSAHTSSRQNILERVRLELSSDRLNSVEDHVVAPRFDRSYQRESSMTTLGLVELMTERLQEYGAHVLQCRPEQIRETVMARLAASGRRGFVVPPGLPASWIEGEFACQTDHGLSDAEIERAEGVVTSSFCGVADSGTIILHHTSSEGRRVLCLLPDWHLCILRVSDIVQTLPEYFQRVQSSPALATLISGPSATADIEMTRIKGVHGPRLLSVILVLDPAEH